MGTPSYNSSEETKQILTVIALIIIAMGFIFWLLRRAAGQLIQRRQLSEISRLARSPIEMHDSNGRDWGIAIAGDKLYVVDDQVVGSIPLTAIRQVSWKISGYDVTIYRGSSILKAFISSVSNKRSEKGAALTSGLSITGDDPSQPVWFFRCTNEMVLRRWNNIITQAIARGEVKLEAA
ncbi:hypothetical protein IC232_04435 [Microvirga sp. BT688]|uniref:hypothetical protein n=1 Tax=Microvirga sp. TaxID=1873136 RepID=UPI001683223C|nr:hypothetical protein [Microvirga sp.]MBD2745942.1 hypothetical protein [Microvirga sp.]